MLDNDDDDLLRIHKKVKQFFEEIQAEILGEDMGNHIIDVPIDVIFGTDDKIRLICRIAITNEWIHLKCLVMYHKSLPRKRAVQQALWEDLLLGNYMYPDVTFSIDEDKNIFVEADVPTITTLDNFISNFSSIGLGIDHFYNEIIPKLDENIKRTSTVDIYNNLYT
ncbi:MAG: hypothetical protein ACTSVY_16385 [Candidatus Helarchaeota archaeon]